MKIDQLDFRAFGPFCGRLLDFRSAFPGLHIVHGPNEAGKSSAMRGLHALLFGFPPRTGDNFLHPYDQLLVGGLLTGPDGELRFYRRKKAKNDLFDAGDKPLPADALEPYLQGLGSDLFSSMYGIDHETLVRGGQSILDQQGEVGQALFSAGAGFASLKAVLDGLEKDGDELFKPRATSRTISQALAHYKELQAQLRAHSLGSQEWQKRRNALARAEEEWGALSARKLELERVWRQLERLRGAMPFLSRRRYYLEKLQAMGEVFPLPEDFSARRRDLVDKRRAVRIRLETTEARLASLLERREALSLNRAVLDHAAGIEDTHQRLGAYRKGQEDRPRLEGQRIAFKTEAARLLRRIRPDLDVDRAEALRPGLGKRRLVQALGQRQEAVVQGVRQAEGRLREVRRDLQTRLGQLESLPPAGDGTVLLQVLQQVRQVGDLDEEIRARGHELQMARSGCESALKRLGLWPGPLEDAPALRLPLPETVNEFEDALMAAEEEIKRQTREKERAEATLAELGRERGAIEHAAIVPSEAELAACRARRDLGWGLLRRSFVDGEDIGADAAGFDAEQPLPDAYEQCVDEADRTADRMYREADRVQKYAQLLAGIDAAGTALAEAEARLEEAAQTRGELRLRWAGLWADCGISPLGPREMRAWIANFEVLRRQVAEMDRGEAELAVRKARCEELRGLLLDALAPADAASSCGDGLQPVLRVAEAEAERLREVRARREALDRAVSELRGEEDKAAAALQTALENREAWREAWREAVAGLGLGADASPEEAADYVDTVQECLSRLDEADSLRRRREGIDRDARAFEQGVSGLLTEVLGEGGGGESLDAPLAVGRLKGLLSQAEREQAVLARLEEEAGALRTDTAALREEFEALELALAELRALARCADDEAVDAAERRFAEWKELRRGLDKAEEALAPMTEGGSLDDLERLAAGEDPDALPGKIAALQEELRDGVDPELRTLAERVGQEKSELARMDGGEAAARIGEEMQEVLARISRLTGRYIRLRVASTVLRAEIERYRAENQDPLLAIASDLFRELTLGAFTGLRADLDEADRPVLVGLRPAGTWVPVAGMSSGTRDQLYLALRLASLRRRAETAEPMPFIVDDILINFDERRAEATLKALADMADRTQIIMFTHQGLIADLALGLERDDRVFVHRL